MLVFIKLLDLNMNKGKNFLIMGSICLKYLIKFTSKYSILITIAIPDERMG